MRRFETLLALLAVVLASLAALPIRGRLLYALIAIALLAVVCLTRVRAAIANRPERRPQFDAGERAKRIREERRRRLPSRSEHRG